MKNIEKRSLFLSPAMVIVALVMGTLLIEFIGLDQFLADLIYRWEGSRWHLRDEWLTAVFIHKGGKYLSITILLVVITLLFVSYRSPTVAAWKEKLWYLLIATTSGSLVVSLGKTITHISCPWDFSRYGGTQEYLPLIEQLWERNGSECFPAGHASAGFAWVSLYFVGLHLRSTWRWPALFFALSLGIVFGISQQLRGAHFISHDLWSFGLCWMASLICYEVMLKRYEPAY